jgi:hypothetical protein
MTTLSLYWYTQFEQADCQRGAQMWLDEEDGRELSR